MARSALPALEEGGPLQRLLPCPPPSGAPLDLTLVLLSAGRAWGTPLQGLALGSPSGQMGLILLGGPWALSPFLSVPPSPSPPCDWRLLLSCRLCGCPVHQPAQPLAAVAQRELRTL